MKFSIGNRVSRQVDIHDQNSPLKFGVIVNAYSQHANYCGYYRELYDVKWNRGPVEKKFLPHGLNPVDTIT